MLNCVLVSTLFDSPWTLASGILERGTSRGLRSPKTKDIDRVRNGNCGSILDSKAETPDEIRLSGWIFVRRHIEKQSDSTNGGTSSYRTSDPSANIAYRRKR